MGLSVNASSVTGPGEFQHHKLHPYASEDDTVVQVIASYLSDKYSSEGSSFELSSPEERANDLLARRVHDIYIGPIQVRDPSLSNSDFSFLLFVRGCHLS